MIPFLLLTNAVSFILMGVDKRLAKERKRRIPENTLFLSAACMGALGGILGMYCFRHKTKHMAFVIGFPILLVIEIAVLMAIR